MSKAILKPVVSKLRQLLLKGIAGRMEKLGYSEDGVLLAEKPLSIMGQELRERLQTLFWEMEIKGASEFHSFLEESARTWMHILIFFKTLEIRGMSEAVTAEILPPDTVVFDPRLLPDFHQVPPQAFLEFSECHEKEITDAQKRDGFEEDRDYYALLLYLNALCRSLDGQIPILFGDQAHQLLFPDLETAKEILSLLDQVSNEEFLEDDFLGWIYQYWVDTNPTELAAAKAERGVSYACDLYEQILAELSREQTESGEYYTPRWVIRYIVEESVKICYEKKRSVEAIRLIDPACGAGNFLVYAFEVFFRYYSQEYPQWPVEQVVQTILEQNLYGCELKRESLQIAAVNLWLKARQKAADAGVKEFCVRKMNLLLADSLVRWEREEQELEEENENLCLFDEARPSPEISSWYGEVSGNAEAARTFFQQKFQVVVMNPPFVDARKMDAATSKFLKEEYEENSRNLFGAFIERVFELTEKGSVIGFISSDTFFYLSSFAKLRSQIMKQATIRTLLSLGRGVFEGPTVDAAISIFEVGRKYRRELTGANLAPALADVPKDQNAILTALANSRQYKVEQSQFRKIRSCPFLFDLSSQMREVFSEYRRLGSAGRHYALIKQGMATGDNEKYLYKKWEIPEHLLGKQFYPYAKGGGYSKYRNDITEYIDWRDDARSYYSHSKKARKNYLGSFFSDGDTSLFLKEAITYSDITSENRFSARLLPAGCIFDVKGSCLFPRGIDTEYLLGFINSKFVNYILKKLNPTPSFQVGDLARIPYKAPDETTLAQVKKKVKELIKLQEFLLGFAYSSDFYHGTELAYGFQKGGKSLEEAYRIFQNSWERAEKRKAALQKEIDRSIYRLYGLSRQDIQTVEGEFPDLAAAGEKDSAKKEAALSYLRAIVKDSLAQGEPRLYRDQEIETLLRLYFDQTFGASKGYQIIEEIEAVLGRTMLQVIRGGAKIGTSLVTLAGEGRRDAGEPLLRQKVLTGTGNRKCVVIWHAGQFKLELDEDSQYAMQNEIRRLHHGYFVPKLQKVKEELQNPRSSAEEKLLLQEEQQLEECVEALEAWNVVE